jgi:hypothetical protein
VTVSGAFRLALVIVTVLLVQSTLGLDVRIAGAHPELMWLLPITAGLWGDAELGAVVGFVSGLATDLFLPTPFGLSALVGTLLGFAVGAGLSPGGPLGGVGWGMRVLVALAGSAGAAMLYAVLGAVLGQEQMLRVDLGAIGAVAAVTNVLALAPVSYLMRWAIGAVRVDGTRSPAGAPW